jgi:hypothetical protein
MYQPPTAPQRIGGVLDDGFALFRASIKSTFLLAVAGGMVSAPFNRLAQRAVVDEPNLGGIATAMLMGLAVTAITMLFMAAIVFMIDRIAKGATSSIAEAFSVALRRLPALLVSGIIYFLALVVGLVLLFVPGVFIGVALLFFYMAVIAERKGPIESLQYSWQLVRGNWWRTAALATIITIVIAILYLLLGVVAGVVVVLGTDISLESGEMPWFIDFVVGPLIVGVVGPLGYSLFMSVYRDLKLRREGGDIAARIAAAEA